MLVPLPLFGEVYFLQPDGALLEATEGHIHLEWQKGAGPFQLVKSRNQTFDPAQLLYEGPDRAYFITGLLEGDHFFKIIDNNKSEAIIRVSVTYPARELVILSLIIGGLLFSSLCAIIFMGNRQHARTSA